jgi:hypothetical protein
MGLNPFQKPQLLGHIMDLTEIVRAGSYNVLSSQSSSLVVLLPF